jgi:hypothetical protein
LSLLNARQTALLAAVVALGACTTAGVPTGPSNKAAPSDLDRIVYEVSSCRGFCPSYRFTIATDGNAHFEGLRSTRVAGRTPVNATPMLFAEIRESLAPARAAESRNVTSENCSNYVTDLQTVTVAWEKAGEVQSSLAFDLGCHDPRFDGVRRSLAAARKLFPINGAVGRVTDF